jgi:hypothetical protein
MAMSHGKRPHDGTGTCIKPLDSKRNEASITSRGDEKLIYEIYKKKK